VLRRALRKHKRLDFMFRYLTSYRFYTLAKSGIGLSYLWYVLDLFWIHSDLWHQPFSFLPGPSNIIFSGYPSLDAILRQIAIFVSSKAMVWLFVLAAPSAVGLYLWGHHKWLQFSVGCWMSFSMISLTSLVGVFNSMADIWINYVFVAYSLSALICSSADWKENEAGFSLAKWKNDPVLASRYAWLVVLIQFAVYFFAGLTKLRYGWTNWMTGTALQNLAFDSAMRGFARGIPVPFWISLVLCYITLFQRLVVPFGFYFKRFRFWSVLILGSMHIGYAILMKVAVFPVIGIASLLMILPTRAAALPQPASRPRHKPKRSLPQTVRVPIFQNMVMCLFSLWLILESARLIIFQALPWENKLMIVPAWRMFADGGANAGGQWRLLLETPHGEVDATDIALEMLPHLWRDRFYIDLIFHEILSNNTGPGSLPARLADATAKMYAQHQLQINASPTVLNCGFDIYSNRPLSQTSTAK
jgi:hypothetical protein